jgi:hypothetical protein
MDWMQGQVHPLYALPIDRNERMPIRPLLVATATEESS